MATGYRARRHNMVAACLLVVAGMLLAACGDDDDSAETAGGTAATTEPQATTAGVATTAPEGGGGAGADEAARIVADYTKRPTTIELNQPVGAPIPTGLSVYWISCGVESCEAEADMVQTAAGILGWNYTKLSTDGSPQQIQNAWTQVVREKPDAVLYTATPRSQIDQYITQAAANGTTVAACCVTEPPGNGLTYVMSTPDTIKEMGRLQAAWVVNDAAQKGKTPGALYLDIPDLPIIASLKTEFENEFTQLCPDCPHKTLPFGLTDLQSAPDQIVSALRADPELNYVLFSTDSAFTAVPAALKAAGRTDVTVFGAGPATTNLNQIKTGEMAGSIYYPYWEVMFAMVDAVARAKAGVEVLPEYTLPWWMLNADNIPTVSELFPAYPDTEQHFKELWGKA